MESIKFLELLKIYLIEDISKIIIEYLRNYENIKFLNSFKLTNIDIYKILIFNNKIYIIDKKNNKIFELKNQNKIDFLIEINKPFDMIVIDDKLIIAYIDWLNNKQAPFLRIFKMKGKKIKSLTKIYIGDEYFFAIFINVYNIIIKKKNDNEIIIFKTYANILLIYDINSNKIKFFNKQISENINMFDILFFNDKLNILLQDITMYDMLFCDDKLYILSSNDIEQRNFIIFVFNFKTNNMSKINGIFDQELNSHMNFRQIYMINNELIISAECFITIYDHDYYNNVINRKQYHLKNISHENNSLIYENKILLSCKNVINLYERI